MIGAPALPTGGQTAWAWARWLVLLTAVAAGAGATAYTGIPLSWRQLALYALSLGAIVGAATLFDRRLPPPVALPTAAFTRRDGVLIAALTALALLLRVWQLDSIPRAIWADEINSLDNAIAILQGGLTSPAFGVLQGLPSPFISGDWDTVAVHLYSIAAAVALVPDRQIALRLVGVIPAVLAVPLVYLFVRPLFGRPLALCASLLLAISSWPILLARYGYHWGINGFTEALALYWLVRALHSGRLRHFVYAGFGLGLGVLYTNAATLLPLAVVLFAGYVLVLHRSWMNRRMLAGFALLVVGAVLVAGPRLSVGFTHPNMLGRHRDLSVFSRQNAPQAAQTIPLQAEEILLSFNVSTDDDEKSHPRPANDPLLDPISAACFGLGILYALLRLANWRWALLVFSFLVLLVPAVLSVGQTVWATAYHACGVICVLFIFAALPFAMLWQFGRDRPRLRPLVLTVLALVFGAIGVLNYRYYFVDFPAEDIWHSGWMVAETWGAQHVLAAPAHQREIVNTDLQTWGYFPDLTFRRRSYELFSWPDQGDLPALLTTALQPTQVLASGERDYQKVTPGQAFIALLSYYFPHGIRRDTPDPSGAPLATAYLMQPPQIEQAYGLRAWPPPAPQRSAPAVAPIAVTWPGGPGETFPLVAHLSGTLIVPQDAVYELALAHPYHGLIAIDGHPFTQGYLSTGLYNLTVRATVMGPGTVHMVWREGAGPLVLLPRSQVLQKSLPPWGLTERQTFAAGGTLEHWVPALWFDSGGAPPAPRPLSRIEWVGTMRFPATGTYQITTPTQAALRLWLDGHPLVLTAEGNQQWSASLSAGWHRVRISVTAPAVADFHFSWQAPNGQRDLFGGTQSRPLPGGGV